MTAHAAGFTWLLDRHPSSATGATDTTVTPPLRGIATDVTATNATEPGARKGSVRCTTNAGAFTRARITRHPHKMGRGTVPIGVIATQNDWRKMIKRKCRANDLDALRLAFAIKINDRWNNDLRKGADHG